MNIEAFVAALAKENIVLTKEQINMFAIYYDMLISWNEKMNLTSITDHEGVYLKHFYDSLSLSFGFPLHDERLCDIGAGAGFPSIPLKIVYPDLRVTIVDSLNKRITFLNALIETLGLTHVEAISARAEIYAKDHREVFDVVTARAVARLEILDELCLPLVKKGGYFIALKGADGMNEYRAAQGGIEKLGGVLRRSQPFLLENQQGERINFYIEKVRATPLKYPRPFGKIKKSPLK